MPPNPEPTDLFLIDDSRLRVIDLTLIPDDEDQPDPEGTDRFEPAVTFPMTDEERDLLTKIEESLVIE